MALLILPADRGPYHRRRELPRRCSAQIFYTPRTSSLEFIQHVIPNPGRSGPSNLSTGYPMSQVEIRLNKRLTRLYR